MEGALGSAVSDAAAATVDSVDTFRCRADRIITGAVVLQTGMTIVGVSQQRAGRARFFVWDAAASLIATI